MQAETIFYFSLVLWDYGTKQSFYKEAIKIKEAQAKYLSFNK